MLGSGERVTANAVLEAIGSEFERLRAGPDADGSRLAGALEVFERVALPPDFVEFLTFPAYDLLD